MITRKKGALFDVIIWIVVGFVTLVFLAAWLFMHTQLTAVFVSIPDNGNSGANISQAAQQTFGAVQESLLPGLNILGFSILAAMAISIFVSNFLIRANPMFFILYVFISVVAIPLAATVSNVYEELLLNSAIGSTLTSLSAGTYIMLYLPIWTAVIALFGAVFLFIGIIRRPELTVGV